MCICRKRVRENGREEGTEEGRKEERKKRKQEGGRKEERGEERQIEIACKKKKKAFRTGYMLDSIENNNSLTPNLYS